MRMMVLLLALLTAVPVFACSELLDHKVRKLGGDDKVHLCEAYQGKVIVIVNTASKCGYTDQYDSLEKLYREYRDQGLVVLGFPSNDFGAQEPGTEQQIKSFCRLTYGVEFPMFAKSRVSQYSADPLYKGLAQVSGKYPAWNFHKYLIARDGSYVADYASAVDPLDSSMLDAVRQELIRQF